MAKRGTKTAKKENGTTKTKPIDKAEEFEQPASEPDVMEVEPDDEPVATSSKPGPASKKAKLAKKSISKPAVQSSSGRKGGRPVKAPERFTNPDQPRPRKKTSGNGNTGGRGEYNVEAIRGILKENGKFKFLIKWENYPEKENSWEPEGNVTNCQSHIRKFVDSLGRFVD